MRRLVLGLLVAFAAASAQAGPYKAPRNGFGQPDLQGVWNTHFVLPLEARPDAPGLTVSEAESAAYAKKIATETSNLAPFRIDPEVADLANAAAGNGMGLVKGQRRTREIVQPADGKLPLTPAARGQMRFIERALQTQTDPPFPDNNPEDRPSWERCLVGQGQPPIAIVSDINPREIVQTKDAVVILTEYGPDLRIIPLTDKHGPLKVDRSPLGDSIAHWDGETLVIETIGLPAKDMLRPFPTFFVPPSAKVTERYTRVSKTELLYQFTVEDPQVYTGPWLAEYSLYPSGKPLMEFACHEGNYSLPDILAGARARDREAAAAKPKLTATQAPGR
jgi:hypothetical protein